MDKLNHPRSCAGRENGVNTENALHGRVFSKDSETGVFKASFIVSSSILEISYYSAHELSLLLLESVREESTDQAPRKSSHRGGRLRKGGPTPSQSP